MLVLLLGLDYKISLRYRIAMRNYLIDTIGTVIFFTVIAATSELLIVGLEPIQVLFARFVMIPVMVITARPYGLWRDWVFRKMRPRNWKFIVAVDIATFISFQVPVYVATLALAGTTLSEIVTAVSVSIFFMVLLSRPFGMYLEAFRRWAGASGN